MPLEIVEWRDQSSWDHFVGSQLTGHFQQGWGWGEVAGPFGGTIFRFAVVDGSDIRAAVSVLSTPLRGSAINQLYVWRGPVVDEPTPEIFDLILGRMRQIASEQNAFMAKIEPTVLAGDRRWIQLLHQSGYRPLFPPSQPRSTWILDLEPDLDRLLENMKPKWRYNIRLAAKKGVEVSSGTEADIESFYDLYQETARRDHFYIHDRSLYEIIFKTYWKLDQFELLIARFQGTPIAAVSLVHIGRHTYYLYGASIDRHREVMAPHLLQWEAIQWAKRRGAMTYDFRGVPDIPAEGQEMYGVYRFKQGFGGRHVTYMETYAQGFNRPVYDVWRTYWQGRHLFESARRRMNGHPQRQWA